MNKNQKWISSGALLLIILISIGLFALKGQNTNGAAVYDLEEVKLAINIVPNSALVFIAEDKEYFAEEGLNIQYYSFPTGKLALDSLISGGADIATTADIPITLAGLAKQDISVVATIEYSNNNIQVVARKDSGIYEPQDLIGKKIATTRGGGPLFFTYKFLEKYNIDINLVNLNPSDMVTALIKGEIDAFIVFEPYPFLATEEIGEEKVNVFSEPDLYGETWNIVIMDEFNNENKGTVFKFINALVKAEQYLNENPKESLEIVAKNTGLDVDVVSGIMKKQNFGVVLNNELIGYLKEEAIWAIKQGLSSSNEIPNYIDVINREYLLEINPEAVTI